MMSVAVQSFAKRKGLQLLAPMALSAAMLLPWSSAQALPFTSDISITGSSGFHDAWGVATDVTQTGSYSVTQGGVTATNTVDGTTVTGSNPLAASLTDIGDGFGIAAHVDSTTSGAEGDFPVDVGFSISNSSASGIYKITLQLDYDHSVMANGADAFTSSDYSLFDNSHGLELLYRGVTSDALYGDRINGGDSGTYGSLMADNGNLFLDLIINPGETLDLVLNYELSSGVYSDQSSIVGDFTSFLSVAGVERIEGGAAVPVPATLSLMLAGLLGLMANRHRHC